jgi:predicted metalloprotease with PDZ domain
MRSIFQTIAAAGAVLFCVGAAAPPRIDYTLTPVLQDGALRAVQIDLSFRGEPDGESDIRLPDSWGGQNELWTGIEGLEIVSGASAIRNGEAANQRVVTHRSNARIHIRYRVVQDWEGVPRAEIGNVYRPTIQPTYFHLIGNAFMVTPDAADAGARVRFRVRNLPRGWAYASDMEHPDLRLDEVWSSVAVAGDFRILRDARSNVRVAIRGEWQFSDAEFLSQAANILSSEREFWGDEATPYLVTVLHLDGPEGWISIGGTGLDDAFAFFATPNAESAPIARTLAHESFHTWISPQVGGLPQDDQALQYWLSEGFTEFYTARLMVRGGQWNAEQYAADLNDALLAYAQSPVRAATNAQVLANFWSDRDTQRLPYQRGRFLALMWEARLRASGHSMDDVVHDMRMRARSGQQYAVETFLASAAGFGLDPRADIEANITQGMAILLPEDLLAPCGRIVTREAPVFHRGFDIQATQANSNVIAGVDPNLPAYAAGLRNGMVLIRRDGGEIGNSELEIAYVARDGDTERTFRYMPRGASTFTVQRLELAENLEGDRLAQCLSVIGG